MIYDRHNVREYVTAGEEGEYICCNCGQPTTYDGSISHQGYHLICIRCHYKLQHLLGSNDIMLQIHKAGEYESRYLKDKLTNDFDKACQQNAIYVDTDSFYGKGDYKNAEENNTISKDTDSVSAR